MKCRSCGSSDLEVFLDLGRQPLANSYLPSPNAPEKSYPLVARVCRSCLLVQCDPTAAPGQIFIDYPFFSSMSQPWIAHCRQFAAREEAKYELRRVVEIGSNDGTLLAQFGPHVNKLGIDPAKNVAEVAEARGVHTITEFFTEELARALQPADLVIANNVIGHVPDINDFVAGLRALLAPHGRITIETPHLLRLIERCEYDTIYHEHYNYWSLHALDSVLHRHDLVITHVDELPIHGGSLRVTIEREGSSMFDHSVEIVSVDEVEAGLWDPDSPAYTTFADRAYTHMQEFRHWLADRRDRYELVAGAGAPAKANTLLNAAGITTQLLSYTTDTSPHKQHHWMPGSRIPILKPEEHLTMQPDYIVVLAWNWYDEVVASLPGVTGQFVNPRSL